MAHDFPVPDPNRLERLIVSVYKRMPEPDHARLHMVEERLTRALPASRPRRKVNTIPFWIVLLLGGGLATAAWWLGDIYNKHRQDIESDETFINDVVRKKDGNAVVPAPEKREHEDGVQSGSQSQSESPVIYQRER